VESNQYNIQADIVRRKPCAAFCVLWCLALLSAICLGGIVPPCTLIAQSTRDRATTLATVEVQDKQNSITIARSIQPTTILSAEEIRSAGARQISDVLLLVPSLFVQNYGGLGGLKTVSLRGMNSAQTLITFNGLRLNSAQNGGVDISTIPADMLEQVQVERGGKSAIFGSGAMSGVLNFTPRQALQPIRTMHTVVCNLIVLISMVRCMGNMHAVIIHSRLINLADRMFCAEKTPIFALHKV
jgi:outer membrane cobalamin receptor